MNDLIGGQGTGSRFRRREGFSTAYYGNFYDSDKQKYGVSGHEWLVGTPFQGGFGSPGEVVSIPFVILQVKSKVCFQLSVQRTIINDTCPFFFQLPGFSTQFTVYLSSNGHDGATDRQLR